MASESASQSLDSLRGRNAALIDRLTDHLLEEAQGARWQLSREAFAQALHRSAAKRLGSRPASAGELDAYLRSLELEDLALACACDAGNAAAWEFFVARYRPELRAAARAILRASGSADDAGADDLADSLYAELYGLSAAGKSRERSLFQYFHGRSKLGTWLRSVLAQRHVDALRAARRMVSLDSGGRDDSGPQTEPCSETPPADPDRRRYLARFDAALTVALVALPARDRFRLALFYVDQRTLAETGRALGEHESTASRQLERTRRHLRKRVGELLSRRAAAAHGTAADPGLDSAQIALAFAYALEEGAFDLSRALSEGPTGVGSL